MLAVFPYSEWVCTHAGGRAPSSAKTCSTSASLGWWKAKWSTSSGDHPTSVRRRRVSGAAWIESANSSVDRDMNFPSTGALQRA